MENRLTKDRRENETIKHARRLKTAVRLGIIILSSYATTKAMENNNSNMNTQLFTKISNDIKTYRQAIEENDKNLRQLEENQTNLEYQKALGDKAMTAEQHEKIVNNPIANSILKIAEGLYDDKQKKTQRTNNNESMTISTEIENSLETLKQELEKETWWLFFQAVQSNDAETLKKTEEEITKACIQQANDKIDGEAQTLMQNIWQSELSAEDQQSYIGEASALITNKVEPSIQAIEGALSTIDVDNKLELGKVQTLILNLWKKGSTNALSTETLEYIQLEADPSQKTPLQDALINIFTTNEEIKTAITEYLTKRNTLSLDQLQRLHAIIYDTSSAPATLNDDDLALIITALSLQDTVPEVKAGLETGTVGQWFNSFPEDTRDEQIRLLKEQLTQYKKADDAQNQMAKQQQYTIQKLTQQAKLPKELAKIIHEKLKAKFPSYKAPAEHNANYNDINTIVDGIPKTLDKFEQLYKLIMNKEYNPNDPKAMDTLIGNQQIFINQMQKQRQQLISVKKELKDLQTKLKPGSPQPPKDPNALKNKHLNPQKNINNPMNNQTPYVFKTTVSKTSKITKDELEALIKAETEAGADELKGMKFNEAANKMGFEKDGINSLSKQLYSRK